MLTGTLAFTAVWSAFALENAPWSVAELWSDPWNWPAPPQPIWQSEPAVWVWSLVWLVSALLPAPLSAPLAANWLALLSPPEMSPALMLTGTLAFTAVWSALRVRRRKLAGERLLPAQLGLTRAAAADLAVGSGGLGLGVGLAGVGVVTGEAAGSVEGTLVGAGITAYRRRRRRRPR